ncbi:hypothetical protein CRES_1354 [Corynebacterium resistens DSM 45100]|uniref:Uncharacterized protein n=1 Tax=Corynebacterium resistens (strain DSM 45100 / JCM 12819 / GTC 2026 / SICGH 158) TaxID=662755 RepID=F8DYW4_CORRG|nr:hypothetical protein CRES_1354 [Corynebacterium resistens DSM 45100]
MGVLAQLNTSPGEEQVKILLSAHPNARVLHALAFTRAQSRFTGSGQLLAALASVPSRDRAYSLL